ncbi:MAG: ferritin-like protein [Planctomycetes bacterium]|nr:ferritin-like protein [Planctomycetota bacterium]
MGLSRITSVEELHRHLYAALQLEHATIPAYLTALYSIHPGTNTEAVHILRAVAVEEMLHLTLAANILNAVGGTPDLTRPDFVPVFPTFLPDGETDFEVGLQRFSKEALATFLKIERPGHAPEGAPRTVRRPKKPGKSVLHASHTGKDAEEHFYSIGEFYDEISRSLATLHEDLSHQGRTLFVGDPARQITPEFYYSGGGELIAVTDLASAQAAIRLISEQGEGKGKAIFDYEGELSHYYRFEQLLLGRYYQTGDKAGHPTGAPIAVDWKSVYPIKANARLSDYAEGSELREAAFEFNRSYRDLLEMLTRAFTGEPRLLTAAVGDMFRIKELFLRLMRNPMDGTGTLHAAPPFEIASVTEVRK